MPSPFPRLFSLPRDDEGRPLLPTGFAAGVAAFAVGTLAVAGWLALATDGPFSTLDAATEMTGGKPVPAPFVPVWTFGGAMGLPVRLVETTGSGRAVVLRNLVDGLDGPADPWYWLGALPPACLFLAGAVTARLTAWSRRPAEGFATGSSVAVGFAAAVAVTALVARVGLGDVPPNAEGFVRVGSTGFHPTDLDGDSVGLPLWGAFSGLVYGVVFGGLGGAVASLVGRLVSAVRNRSKKA
ncbi:hypothetical protein C456_06018 [Haloferax volcanii DSM 14919]|uniref:DUF7978 domain-containing protein n=1 Tax=Haloferax lucentense (strain DSM 14919 / JCM 9276 / NCIMB 13854 / Aa 2.2) TaxID=1230452 RepID=M0GVS9_HALL2|nr:hypothetical protein [Haloferax lucentense]ELZ75683.1 hypothetical protein C456_06018 [Haloferax lucentense DSM 14919]